MVDFIIFVKNLPNRPEAMLVMLALFRFSRIHSRAGVLNVLIQFGRPSMIPQPADPSILYSPRSWPTWNTGREA